MSVKMRLTRTGAKKRPSYRVVVADSRYPRDGRFLEILGHYNPIADPVEFEIDQERALDWLKKGAQPSDTVRRLLKKAGVIGTEAAGE
ncbi:MAG TPA: 30S ribosomal protein S16 [Firmicutes bacterium]|jgi:small subunit ribosomal protein S16|nr:30S ribosomal protein S16 [Bacillota bacterium]HAW71516.1 30S ribosomal protein S16 [Bacillota bacterium]HAZ21576.1 30S ribosomal protein S16 [Bacillota bacterium]HBE06607.1 30S ribosomal protein S16 [Bacillota bacterium]HBG44746.1 30S ribosomal protein S16 [Bacillota bacterium]